MQENNFTKQEVEQWQAMVKKTENEISRLRNGSSMETRGHGAISKP